MTTYAPSVKRMRRNKKARNIVSSAVPQMPCLKVAFGKEEMPMVFAPAEMPLFAVTESTS